MKKYLLPVLILILILSLNACRRSQASTPKSGSPSPNVTGLPSEENSIASANQSNATPTLVEPYIQTAGSFLIINEIGLGPGGYVALTNFTSVPAATKGLYLCQGRQPPSIRRVIASYSPLGRLPTASMPDR